MLTLNQHVARAQNSELADVFMASLDSFRIYFMEGKLKQAHIWVDAAYRSVCDSNTYYAYKSVESYLQLAEGSIDGLQNNFQSVINYFNGRNDDFSRRVLSTAFSGMGNYMLVTDYDKSIEYFARSRELSAVLGDEVFGAYNLILASEAYQRGNHGVEAALCSRELLNSKVGHENKVLRFMSQLQLFKIYTQMRAFNMAESYSNEIEREGYCNSSIVLEARYLLRKVDYLYAIEKYDEALESSVRLQQTCDLVGTSMEVWRVHLQAAKVYTALGRFDEAMEHVKICKSSEFYVHGFKFTGLYSSYHIDLVEAWIAVGRKQYDLALSILKRSNPPRELLDKYEFGLSYYQCLEDIYSRSGDYRNAVKMVDATNQLRSAAFDTHSRQRSLDLENIYKTDTTLINQDASLQRKNSAISKLQDRIIIWILVGIIVFMLIVLMRSIFKGYRRNQQEQNDIEHKRTLEREIAKQTFQLRTQKNELTQKNNDIRLSQGYASLIQQGILPDKVGLNFPGIQGSFIIYEPIDLISGDFYWYKQYGSKIVVFCGDCSGRGVAGAMMTMVGMTLVSDIMRNTTTFNPADLLEELDHALVNMMPDIRRSDAMDVSVAVIDTEAHTVCVSAAQSDVVAIIGNEVVPFVADNRRIGFVGAIDLDNDIDYRFTSQTLNYNPGDSLYLFTDGVLALSGGIDGDRMTVKRFVDILTAYSSMPVAERGDAIRRELYLWMRGSIQVDDYTIIGIEL